MEALFREKVHREEKMTEEEVNGLIDETNRPIKRFNAVVFLLLLATIVWTFIYSYSLLVKLS